MILVRVGQHDAGDVAPLLHEIADVGKDEIDAGQVLFAGERHADVDDEPGAAPLVAQPIDREIHADLADTAERREHEFTGHC